MDSCGNTTFYFTEYRYLGEARNYKTLKELDYVKLVFIALILVGTLFGNICVITVIGLNKKMRTAMNTYVVNLALADLLVCSICMTSFLWKNMLNNHIFVLGPVMCKLIHFSQMTTLTCSVMTMIAIACDRANAVLFPFGRLVAKSRPKLVILVIWLVSIAVSTPLLFVRTLYTLYFSDFVQLNCGDSWPFRFDDKGKCKLVEWVPQLYYTFVSVTLFFLPVTIMAITYSLILWRLKKPRPGETNTANLTSQVRNVKKVIKMFFTVLIFFVICWMPIQIVVLYDKYRTCAFKCELPYWYEEATRVAEFLAFSNSFLNPIIYIGFTPDFRENFCRCLRRCCGKRRRRFGSSGFLQRFRTTLTTLSSSLPSTERRKRTEKSLSNAGNGIEQSLPNAGNGTVSLVEAGNNEQGANEAIKDTIL